MLPFPGGIEDTANGTAVLSAASALIYLLILGAGSSLLRSAVKTLSVALLAVLAVLQGAPMLLFAALALSAVGDWFLSRDGEPAFLAGLGSFLAAHIAYAALFWTIGGGLADITGDVGRLALAVVMILLALAMLVLLMRAVGPGMRLPIVLYICAIVAMGLTAVSQPVWLVTIGALSFMASDTILAGERFLVPAISPHRVWMRYAVWVLYYGAQALMLVGIVLR